MTGTRAGGTSEVVEVNGRRVMLTSLDKVLWPATGFSKAEMVDYYRGVAPALLPHLRGRAVTLGRFPNGVEERGFAQTECRGRPEWMATREVRTRGGQIRRHCLLNDLPSLLWAANQNTIELHAPPALPQGDRPDAVIFDLDPGPGVSPAACYGVAMGLRAELEGLGLQAVVKTSGGDGLHVLVPVGGEATFEESKAFARGVAERMARRLPGEVTDSVARASRKGRVLIDWLQNDPGRLLVLPYSLRAAELPAVSLPVAWEEVESARDEDEALVFLARDALPRIDQRGDLFEPALSVRQRLPG